MRKVFDEPFKITQKFGENPDYYSQWGFKGHEGLDLIPQSGKGTNVKIYAVETGVVVRDTDDPLGDPPNKNYGKKVVLLNLETRHAWWYCHLESNNVSNGQRIEQRQEIGIMGATGNSSGKHLHLGLRECDASGNAINNDNGYKGFINPSAFLEETENQQKIIDELRKARDDNWNLYQETKTQLEGAKTEIDSLRDQLNRDNENHEAQLKQFATILGSSPDTAELSGKMMELVGIEDRLREAQKRIDQLSKEALEDQKEIDKLEKESSMYTEEKQSLLRALHELEEAKIQMEKDLEKFRKQSPIEKPRDFWEWFKSLFHL